MFQKLGDNFLFAFFFPFARVQQNVKGLSFQLKLYSRVGSLKNNEFSCVKRIPWSDGKDVHSHADSCLRFSHRPICGDSVLVKCGIYTFWFFKTFMLSVLSICYVDINYYCCNFVLTNISVKRQTLLIYMFRTIHRFCNYYLKHLRPSEIFLRSFYGAYNDGVGRCVLGRSLRLFYV